MKYFTDLILGKGFCIFIFFYFPDSSPSVLNGLHFYFSLRDSASQELAASVRGLGTKTGADLGGGCWGCVPPPEMTFGFLIQLVFCKKKMWVIGVEVEQETSAPPPEKNPGSAPEKCCLRHLARCRNEPQRLV